MDLLESLNLRIAKVQFIYYPLIVVNLWKNSSLTYERLLPAKPVDWFPERLSPDSFELVKSGKHGQNVYAKIYTRASGKAKCKVSGLVEESKKRVSIPLEELIDKSFEGSCILKLYQTYVGSNEVYFFNS